MLPESDSPLLADIGSFLRKARESQGKTLDEAAAVTRIGKNYLIAIEEGDEGRFPSATYLKGFLRIYAGYLGLSGEEIVGGHQWLKSPVLSRAHETAHPTPEEREGKQKSFRWWVIPLVLTAFSAGIAFIMEKPAENPPERTVAQESRKVAALPLHSIRSSASAPPPASAMAEKTDGIKFTGNQPQRGSILKLKVNQDSSLNITIDDTISQPYELKAGDLIEWKAERGFVIDVSNAGGIEAEFNGRQLPPLGEAGKSAHLVLK